MKKQLMLRYVILMGVTAFSQVQMGNDIDGIINQTFGISVALSHDGLVVAIGNAGPPLVPYQSKGEVRVYRKIQNTWVQIRNNISGLTSGDAFGYCLDISDDGSIVAVGAYGYGNQIGQVTIFQNLNDNWVQMGNAITGEFPGVAEYFGISLSLSSDGSIIAIGANRNSVTGNAYSGCVRVYQNSNNVWTKIGNDIYGESQNDFSGSTVSLSSNGSIVAIGASSNIGNGLRSGHVRVYQNISENWVQIGNDINGEAANDQSGGSISLSANGTTLAIGAERNTNGIGHVRVYQNSSNVWTQIGSDINGVYKVSLSANGQILATGSPNTVENGSQGTAKIYKNVSNTWVQIGANIVGEYQGDYSTSSMNLSQDGAVIAIGAPYNTGNGPFSGHLRVFNLAPLLATNSFVKNDFTIVPNPAQSYFELNGEETIKSVQIYSILGQLVKTFEKQDQYTISNLVKGSYIVKTNTLEGVSNLTLLKE